MVDGLEIPLLTGKPDKGDLRVEMAQPCEVILKAVIIRVCDSDGCLHFSNYTQSLD
jgi:hypothetical protein